MQGLVAFFPEPGHEAKARFTLDPVALGLKLGDDFIDGLPTDTCFLGDLGSCEIPCVPRARMASSTLGSLSRQPLICPTLATPLHSLSWGLHTICRGFG